MGVAALQKLKDQLLKNAYEEAIERELEEDFIQILIAELKRRGLDLK